MIFFVSVHEGPLSYSYFLIQDENFDDKPTHKIQSLYTAEIYTQLNGDLSKNWGTGNREPSFFSPKQDFNVFQLGRMAKMEAKEALLCQLLRKLPRAEHIRACVIHLGDVLLPLIRGQDSRVVNLFYLF